MQPARDMAGSNRAVYRTASAIGEYATDIALGGLGETQALDDLDPRVRHGRVLDLGVGTGRTVPLLAPGAASYAGLDYSAEMVAEARRRHPGTDLAVGDARDLSAYPADSFDLVVFSFNGLDYVPAQDRSSVLAEVRRVLRSDGAFVFSSHNRDHERFNLLPFQRRRRFGRRTLAATLRCLPYLPRHLRMRRRQVLAEEYAVINDEAHQYRMLTYYIDPRAQRAQLGRAGFGTVRVYDMQGREQDDDPASVWLYYSARS